MYGTRIIIKKELQPIASAGNPGGFDYKNYCLLQGIVYQCFLGKNDMIVLSGNDVSFLKSLIFNIRDKILSVLKQYILSPQEAGIAEALLIGYRDDLDKPLVQAYSNTGVVHIIAISGLHLGMIYQLLLLLLPLKRNKAALWLKTIIILVVLWAFSLLAGATPSILRSTVMFSFLAVGAPSGKRSDVYNSLITSAFAIFLFDPFAFRDVGFLLSYAAVLSIAVFFKPIKNLLQFENKLLDIIWSANAVTLAAQILTLPIILYFFKQMPVLFFIANLVAVPLSTCILYAELLLLAVSFIPSIAHMVGVATEKMLWFMNDFIFRINDLPYNVIEPININTFQLYLLYGIIAGFAWWLLKKNTGGLIFGLSFCAIFLVIAADKTMERNNQKKLIVYNISKTAAIDLLAGNKIKLIGSVDDNAYSYNLKPAASFYGASRVSDSLPGIFYAGGWIASAQKKILIVDKSVATSGQAAKIKVDVIIISGNPKLSMASLVQLFDCNEIVFDGSNSYREINRWKKECADLHLQYHSVLESGAFITEL
jgi:competence protein ComEC